MERREMVLWSRSRECARWLLYLAIAFAFVALGRVLWLTPRIVEAEAERTRNQVTGAISDALKMLDERLASVEDSARKEIRTTRQALVAETATARQQSTERIDRAAPAVLAEVQAIRSDLRGQLETANRSIAEVAAVAPILRLTIEHVDEQFFRCPDNPACVQSRWLALSGEGMRTMDSFRRIAKVAEEEAPATGKAVREGSQALSSMAQDGAKLTAKVTGPKRWYQHLGSWIRTAAYGINAIF